MVLSPFTFYRGSALAMADDLAGTPFTGVRVLTDFLFLPVALSLYLALRGQPERRAVGNRVRDLVHRSGLGNHLDRLRLAYHAQQRVAKAATKAQRAAVITAARYPSAVLASSLLFVYNTLVLAVGILMTGFGMLNGAFRKSIAYLGLATGFLGMVSVVGPFFVSALRVTIILTSVLTTV